jgi:deoxyribonuclease-4
LRIGIHTSKAGSLERAALKASELGANTFQIFSSSPRTWRSGKPDPDDIRNLERVRDRHDLTPLVIHDSYLINLASCEENIRRSSIAAFRGEIERALAIGADHLVMHPGNCKGQSMEAGILNVINGLAEAARGCRSQRLTVLLENTVGAGGQIGSRFEELEVIRRLAQEKIELRIGFCLDTCHCFASGNYDVSTERGLDETVLAVTEVLGSDRLHVWHCNDSKGERGSRLDRHEHIGQGKIGREGFRRLLQHPEFRRKAFILETPVDVPGDDQRNVDTLKGLAVAVRGSDTRKKPAKSVPRSR